MNRPNVTPEALNESTSTIFGLRYLEEDEANILDIVGCQSTINDEEEPGVSGTLRFCGDWDTDYSE